MDGIIGATTGHLAVPQLPQELVTRVLRQVDLQQRLGSCSLVCHAWRAAAAAATSIVRVVFRNEGRRSQADSLEQWLAAHAAGVTHLKINNSNNPDDLWMWLQLPCAALTELQQLELTSCQVTLPYDGSSSSCSTARAAQQQQQRQQQQRRQQEPVRSFQQHLQSFHYSSSSDAQPSLACLTSLTALTLVDFTCGFAGGVAGLSALTGLQRLLLGSLHTPVPVWLPKRLAVTWPQRRKQQEQQLLHSAFSSLHQLSQLTQLELQETKLDASKPTGLFRRMQQLKQLKLLDAEVVCPKVLQDLPSSVTKLELKWCAASQLSSSTVPSLTVLTALQHLVLDVVKTSGGLHPGFLSSMQQLRTLSLQGPMSGGLAQQQQQHGYQGAAAAAAAAVPLHALLEALPGLSWLETLVVINTSSAAAPRLLANEVAKYAALLPASTHLTCLQLTWEQGCLLPAGCWQHVLAGSWQLPQLRELRIGSPDSTRARLEPDDELDRIDNMVQCFGHHDLARLVQRCPGLQLLSIPGLMLPGVDMRPLTALTSLTWLFVGGEAMDNDVASSVLATLTGLQHLQIYTARELTDRGLLALSALRRLTQLQVACCDISGHVSDRGDENEFPVLALRTQAAEAPDVWLQLLSRCTLSWTCRAEAASRLVSAIKAQQQDTKAAEERADALQQQLEAERAVSAALRKHLTAAAAQQTG